MSNHQSVRREAQLRLLRKLGVAVLILLAVLVLADIVGQFLIPTDGSAQKPSADVFNEMKFAGYWVRKLTLSIVGGVLYGVLLWQWRSRRHSPKVNS
jgi:hypothetical protein